MTELHEVPVTKQVGRTVQRACFRVDGEYITELVRDRVLEDRWDWSIKLLTRDLTGPDGKGMAYEDAIAILKGEKKLTGVTPDVDGHTDDPFRLVDDEDHSAKSEYIHRLRYHFQGRMRLPARPGFWRPYAMVTSYGGADGRFATKNGGNIPRRENGGHALLDFGKRRALYYADRDSDPALGVTCADPTEGGLVMHRWTLWEPCEAPPVWWETPTDHEVAFARAVEAGRRIDVRGWHLTMEHDEMMQEIHARASLTEQQHEILRAARDRSPEEAAETDRAVAAKEKAEREERIAEQDRRDAEREAARLAHIAETRAAVLKAAVGLPTVTLEWSDDRGLQTATIPRRIAAARAVWGLRGTGAQGLLRTANDLWAPVSESGMKMLNDNRWHTDYVLAAGWDIDCDYRRFDADEEREKPRQSAVFRLEFALQELYRKGLPKLVAWTLGHIEIEHDEDDLGLSADDPVFGAAVLCGSGTVEGVVVHPDDDTEVAPGSIVVVPHAGPEHYIAAVTAHKTPRRQGGAVIAETGGKLSHLAVEGRSAALRVLVLPGAVSLLPVGARVRVNAAKGRIEVLSYGGE